MSEVVVYVAYILTGVLGLVSIMFGRKYAVVKRKFDALVQLLIAIDEALKDGVLTEEELRRIIERAKELINE